MSDTTAADLTRAVRSGAPPRELARIARNAEPARDPIVFKSISGLLATRDAPEAGGRPVVWATHSSTNTQDLHGTWWAPSALNRMLTEARGLTTFMNHRYDVPEDVFGTITDGRLVSRTMTTGQHHVDLDMATAVETENPRAGKTHRMIGNGTRLGQSVGIMLLDWEWQDPDGRGIGSVEESFYGVEPHDREDARLTITDLVFVESSVVGIPSNRRGWQHDAVRSLQRAGVLPGGRADSPGATYGGVSLPETERTMDVSGKNHAANQAGEPKHRGGDQHAGGGADLARGNPAPDQHAGGGQSAAHPAATATREGGSDADHDAGPILDGLVQSGADLTALDAAFDANAGVSAAIAVVTPSKAEKGLAKAERKLAKAERNAGIGKETKPGKAERKAAKAERKTGTNGTSKNAPKQTKDTSADGTGDSGTAGTSDDAPPYQDEDDAKKDAKKAQKKAKKAAKKAKTSDPNVTAAAPVPVPAPPPPPAPKTTITAKSLEKRIKELTKRERTLRKELRRAAKVIKRADATGLYRPTMQNQLRNIDLTSSDLLSMSDDQAMAALHGKILA